MSAQVGRKGKGKARRPQARARGARERALLLLYCARAHRRLALEHREAVHDAGVADVKNVTLGDGAVDAQRALQHGARVFQVEEGHALRLQLDEARLGQLHVAHDDEGALGEAQARHGLRRQVAPALHRRKLEHAGVREARRAAAHGLEAKEQRVLHHAPRQLVEHRRRQQDLVADLAAPRGGQGKSAQRFGQRAAAAAAAADHAAEEAAKVETAASSCAAAEIRHSRTEIAPLLASVDLTPRDGLLPRGQEMARKRARRAQNARNPRHQRSTCALPVPLCQASRLHG